MTQQGNSSCAVAMDSVAAVIRKVVSEIYSEPVNADHLNRDDIRISLESGKGLGRRTILKDVSGRLIGRNGVKSSLKSIHETGAFPSILEKAGTPGAVDCLRNGALKFNLPSKRNGDILIVWGRKQEYTECWLPS